MESPHSQVEAKKRLSDLEAGDIVVLMTDPDYAFLKDPAVEKTVRITCKLSHAIVVGNRRFFISSSKEMEQLDNGQSANHDGLSYNNDRSTLFFSE